MRDESTSKAIKEEEVDLKHIIHMIRVRWRLFATVTGTVVMLSVLTAFLTPNKYLASALLMPSQSSGGGLQGVLQQYGGLASMAGLNLPSGEGTLRTDLGISLVQSRAFLGSFIKKHDIIPELMAAKSWDATRQDLMFDSAIYDAKTNVWSRDVAPPKTSEPSIQEAIRAFTDILSVKKDASNGYVTISVEHVSPIIASEWVNNLIMDINAEVREGDIYSAKKSITFLHQQIEQTPLADLKLLLFELIQSQTETMMIAEVTPEYVFKVIDPAIPPEVPSAPNRQFIIAVGLVMAIFLGVLFIMALPLSGASRIEEATQN